MHGRWVSKPTNVHHKPIVEVDECGRVVAEYLTAVEAGRVVNVSKDSFRRKFLRKEQGCKVLPECTRRFRYKYREDAVSHGNWKRVREFDSEGRTVKASFSLRQLNIRRLYY